MRTHKAYLFLAKVFFATTSLIAATEKGYLIDEVIITSDHGVLSPKEQDIIGTSIIIKKGDIIFPSRQQQRLQRSARYLWEKGYRTRLSIIPKGRAGNAILVIRVLHKLPTIQAIHYQDTVLSTTKEQLLLLTKWEIGSPFVSGSEHNAASALENYLKAQGYAKAHVCIIPQIEGKTVTLTIKIKEGRHYFFGKTSFVGKLGPFQPSDLQRLIPYTTYTTHSFWLPPITDLAKALWHQASMSIGIKDDYNKQQVQKTIDGLRQTYQRKGYLDVSICAHPKAEREDVGIIFEIDAHQCYTIHTIAWNIEEGHIPIAFRKKLNNYFLGKPYSPIDFSTALQQKISTLVEEARANGYQLIITPTITGIQDHQVNITLHVHQRPLPLLNSIHFANIEGDMEIDRKIFSHLLENHEITPGSYLHPEHLEDLHEHLVPFLTSNHPFQLFPISDRKVDLLCDLSTTKGSITGGAHLSDDGLFNLKMGTDNFSCRRLFARTQPFGGMEELALQLNLPLVLPTLFHGTLPQDGGSISHNSDTPIMFNIGYTSPYCFIIPGSQPLLLGAHLQRAITGKKGYIDGGIKLDTARQQPQEQEACYAEVGFRNQQEQKEGIISCPLHFTHQKKVTNDSFFPTKGHLHQFCVGGAVDPTYLPYTGHGNKHSQATYGKFHGTFSYLIPTSKPNCTFHLSCQAAITCRHRQSRFGHIFLGGAETVVSHNPFEHAQIPLRGFHKTNFHTNELPNCQGGYYGGSLSAEARWRPYPKEKGYGFLFVDGGIVGSSLHERKGGISIGSGIRIQLPFFGGLVVGCDFSVPLTKTQSKNAWNYHFYLKKKWSL